MGCCSVCWDVLQCSIFCSHNICNVVFLNIQTLACFCFPVHFHGIVCIKIYFLFILSSVSSQAQRISNRICVASEVQKRCSKRKSEGKCNNVISNNHWRKCLLKSHNLYDPSLQHFSLEEEYACTSLERTAPQTVEQPPNPCLVGSEGQVNTPAFQHRTSDDIKKHNRQIQTVTSRCTCTETKTSRGASQSNIHFQFQVKFMTLTRHNFASFLCFTISEYELKASA